MARKYFRTFIILTGDGAVGRCVIETAGDGVAMTVTAQGLPPNRSYNLVLAADGVARAAFETPIKTNEKGRVSVSRDLAPVDAGGTGVAAEKFTAAVIADGDDAVLFGCDGREIDWRGCLAATAAKSVEKEVVKEDLKEEPKEEPQEGPQDEPVDVSDINTQGSDLAEIVQRFRDEMSDLAAAGIELPDAELTAADGLFIHNIRVYPFAAAGSAARWVRVAPEQLAAAGFSESALANHPFVVGAFNKYSHLIVGRGGSDGELHYALGVPAVYHDGDTGNEHLGFKTFLPCVGTAQDGSRGYWLAELTVAV